jgi:hypothetical protein
VLAGVGATTGIQLRAWRYAHAPRGCKERTSVAREIGGRGARSYRCAGGFRTSVTAGRPCERQHCSPRDRMSPGCHCIAAIESRIQGCGPLPGCCSRRSRIQPKGVGIPELTARASLQPAGNSNHLRAPGSFHPLVSMPVAKRRYRTAVRSQHSKSNAVTPHSISRGHRIYRLSR